MQKSHNEALLETQVAILEELRAIREAMYVRTATSQSVVGSALFYDPATGTLKPKVKASTLQAEPQQCEQATPEAARQ